MLCNVNDFTSSILLVLFFLVFVFIDLGFYIEEAVDRGAFVAALTAT
jgi:hypothetical protein